MRNRTIAPRQLNLITWSPLHSEAAEQQHDFMIPEKIPFFTYHMQAQVTLQHSYTSIAAAINGFYTALSGDFTTYTVVRTTLQKLQSSYGIYSINFYISMSRNYFFWYLSCRS